MTVQQLVDHEQQQQQQRQQQHIGQSWIALNEAYANFAASIGYDEEQEMAPLETVDQAQSSIAFSQISPTQPVDHPPAVPPAAPLAEDPGPSTPVDPDAVDAT